MQAISISTAQAKLLAAVIVEDVQNFTTANTSAFHDFEKIEIAKNSAAKAVQGEKT